MNVARAAIAGLIGTAAMTALLLIEPSVGLPKIAMGQVLSTVAGPRVRAPGDRPGPGLGASTSSSAWCWR